MNNSDNSEYKLFFTLWQKSAAKMEEEVPSFSVIVKDGAVISEGYNTVESDQDVSAHSEIIAIRNAQSAVGSRYLTGCTLVTTLEPCSMCGGAIILSRIEEVVYFAPASREDGISSFSMENIYQKNHFPKLTLLRDEKVVKTIKQFFKKKR